MALCRNNLRQSGELQTCALIEGICGDANHPIQGAPDGRGIVCGTGIHEPRERVPHTCLNRDRTKPVLGSSGPMLDLLGRETLVRQDAIPNDATNQEAAQRDLTRTAKGCATGKRRQGREREHRRLQRVGRARRYQRYGHGANLQSGFIFGPSWVFTAACSSF